MELDCSPAQVLLHFLTAVLGVVVIPKSTDPARIRQNIDVFRLEMTEEQVKVLRGMNRAECDIREHFDKNECPNIFLSKKIHE